MKFRIKFRTWCFKSYENAPGSRFVKFPETDFSNFSGADKKKNGKYGAYIVKDDSANEPFEIDISIGVSNTMRWKIKGTTALAKKIDVELDIAKGRIKLNTGKKKITLNKDNVLSAEI